jgi:hypothetical protein
MISDLADFKSRMWSLPGRCVPNPAHQAGLWSPPEPLPQASPRASPQLQMSEFLHTRSTVRPLISLHRGFKTVIMDANNSMHLLSSEGGTEESQAEARSKRVRPSAEPLRRASVACVPCRERRIKACSTVRISMDCAFTDTTTSARR